MYRPRADLYAAPGYVMASTEGVLPMQLKGYDVGARRSMDREATDRARDFTARPARAGKPFCVFLPYAMVHVAVLLPQALDGKAPAHTLARGCVAAVNAGRARSPAAAAATA